jgi:hypothetical protein
LGGSTPASADASDLAFDLFSWRALAKGQGFGKAGGASQ